MSNNKTYIKQFVSKPKKEKYESFNQFLYNIYQYIPAGNSPVQTEQNLNQNLLIKYTKLNGSKNIILSKNTKTFCDLLQKKENEGIRKELNDAAVSVYFHD